MGILAGLGVLVPFPYYYYLWTNPQSWVYMCGKGNDPSKIMAYVSHFLKLVQFVSLFSVSTFSWPPPFYFWPLFIAGQFLNFRYEYKESGCTILAELGASNYKKGIFGVALIAEFVVLEAPNSVLWQCIVRILLGEPGTYYGVRFGKTIPWVTEFPFGYVKDPQYVGSVMSLVACLSWVPFQYILLWCLGYVFMIHVESTEDPSTRAKPLS